MSEQGTTKDLSRRVVTVGNATLYLGDAREILPAMPSADLILTDPPYGIGESSKNHKSRNRAGISSTDYGKDGWDDQPIPEWMLGLLMEKATHVIMFGGNYYRMPATSCVLVWDKENSGDFADCELAWTNLPGAVRIFRHMWNGMLRASERNAPRVHPTQKPVALMEWALSMAPATTQTVCDPFMGSGTTGVACANLGKAFVGIERSEKYFDIACERIAAAHAQGRLIA